MVPLAPDPPTAVSVKICNPDTYPINEGEGDLHGLTLSIRSAIRGRTYSQTVGG